jgi:hypothetical protein
MPLSTHLQRSCLPVRQVASEGCALQHDAGVGAFHAAIIKDLTLATVDCQAVLGALEVTAAAAAASVAVQQQQQDKGASRLPALQAVTTAAGKQAAPMRVFMNEADTAGCINCQ